jgi:cysteine-rich repeat protein
VCGDRYIDGDRGEKCDDGNHDNGDGCDPTCRYTGNVVTVAGKPGALSHCDDRGTEARLHGPTHIAVVGSRAFISDSAANTVRAIELTDYSVTTLAGAPGSQGSNDGTGGTARFNYPTGIATDGNYVYLADAGNATIRRISLLDASVSTIAGAVGQKGTVDGDPGTSARFSGVRGMVYSAQKLYVIDGCAIRALDLSTSAFPVSTFVGAVRTCGAADATGTAARFSSPEALTVINTGDLYVTDTWNQTIRLVSTTGVVTTPFGQAGAAGSDDGMGSTARFFLPGGIISDDAEGALYVSDTSNNTIRKISLLTGPVTTVAGSVGVKGSADGGWSTARFNAPGGLGASWYGMFVADLGNGTLRRLGANPAVVATIAGAAPSPGGDDGAGASARFDRPTALAAVGGELVVGDVGDCVVRQVTAASWDVTTIAGRVGMCGLLDGLGLAAGLEGPGGFVEAAGLVYMIDGPSVREFDTATGNVTTRAGSSTPGAVDGDGSDARFAGLTSVASDGTYLYVGNACAIRRVSLGAPWSVLTILGMASTCGAVDDTGAAARFGSRLSLAVVDGFLYIADKDNAALRRVDLGVQPYSVATMAGSLGDPGLVDGAGTAARFGSPSAIGYDGQVLFVADGEVIREIEPESMRVTSLVGRPGCRSTIDGTHTRAAFNQPATITYSPATGHLYVVDSEENVLREIR